MNSTGKNSGKKTLGIMLGMLVFLLVLAVVLLSVIIISITNDRNPPSPTLTTVPTGLTSPSTTTAPESTKSPTQTDPASTAPTENPTTGGTSNPEPTTPDVTVPTQPTVTRPTIPAPTDPIQAPNVPIGKVETIRNPDGSVTKKGAFRDSGTPKIHLIVEWEAVYPKENSKEVTLTVSVYLQSYSIGVAARDNGVLTIGDNTIIFRTNRLADLENTLHRTLFTTRTLNYTKPSGSSTLELDIDAAWNFQGSYSGTFIDWISVSGTIEI